MSHPVVARRGAVRLIFKSSHALMFCVWRRQTRDSKGILNLTVLGLGRPFFPTARGAIGCVGCSSARTPSLQYLPACIGTGGFRSRDRTVRFPLNAVERAEAALCVAKDLKRLWQQGNWYVAAWGPKLRLVRVSLQGQASLLISRSPSRLPAEAPSRPETRCKQITRRGLPLGPQFQRPKTKIPQTPHKPEDPNVGAI